MRLETYRHFLFDLGPILKDACKEARQRRDAAKPGSPEREYLNGEVIALYWVVSMLQQQAQGFDIPLADLRLDDVLPDRDLL